jgi:hypothetical protein
MGGHAEGAKASEVIIACLTRRFQTAPSRSTDW